MRSKKGEVKTQGEEEGDGAADEGEKGSTEHQHHNSADKFAQADSEKLVKYEEFLRAVPATFDE